MSVMANADVALAATMGDFGASSDAGEPGQAQGAPEGSKAEGAASEEKPAEGQGTTGKENQDSTTAKATDPAKSPAAEPAEFPEEYKPFQSLISNKKWDPKSKEFVPNLLKGYSELEKATTQAAQDKSLLATRQQELQRRLTGDPQTLNSWRKQNGLPEIPVAKPVKEQVAERKEMLGHINRVLGNKDADGKSEEWLNRYLVQDVDQMTIQAGVEERLGNKTAEQHLSDFRSKAAQVYTDHVARNPADAELFDKYVMPLADPKGLLGSYGLDLAHLALTPEHVQAWVKVGKALQLAENYEADLKAGIDKGVADAMEAKRRAGNAGNVGAQHSKQPGGTPGGGDDFAKALWAGRHGNK